MNVALFGGTFDPPHRGHMAIAKAAADRYALDQVLFAPVAHQPLKEATPGLDFSERLKLVEAACTLDPRFVASDLDRPHPGGGPNYTVDTLARLRNAHPKARLFNLVGADSFHSLARWKDPERLLELAEWIVVSRPGYELGNPPGLSLTSAQRARIHLLDSIHEDVAATELRQRLHAGDPCNDLLPAPVSASIQQHGLYLAPKL
jgi:nicotinate-nucleotide adenylyltransferase